MHAASRRLMVTLMPPSWRRLAGHCAGLARAMGFGGDADAIDRAKDRLDVVVAVRKLQLRADSVVIAVSRAQRGLVRTGASARATLDRLIGEATELQATASAVLRVCAEEEAWS